MAPVAVRTQSASAPPAGDAWEPTRLPSVAAGEGADPPTLAPSQVPPVSELARLLELARGVTGRTQRDAVDTLHAALALAPQEEDARRALADFLLGALASGQLGGLRDTSGRTSRAIAAAALLELGYPYALELAPEDLEHLRAEERPRGRTTTLALVLVGVATLLGLWSAEPGHLGWVLLEALLAGMGVDAYASAAGEEGRRAQGRVLVAAAASISAVGAFFDPGLLVPLLGPVSAALLLDRRP